jgi:hypothetical protein
MSEKYKIFDSEKPYFDTFSILRWIKLFNNPEYTDILIESIKHC